jgi:Tol biopolymer transport system component
MEASVFMSERRLMWVDRDGTERPVMEEWGVYGVPRVSPDGGRVAYERTLGGEVDIWVYDSALGGSHTRLTRNAGLVTLPVWTRDGSRIIYSEEHPQYDLYWRDWRAGTPAQQLLAGPFDKYAQSVSPDGRELAYTVAAESWDIWILQLAGEPEPRPFRAPESTEWGPVFSPDGRWIAYESDESGRMEIWLESYPDTARGRRKISREGGVRPRWSAGGELFYRHDSNVVAVQIDLPSGRPGTPIVLFEGPYLPGGNYDVSPDGRRFVMVAPRSGAGARREVMVVLNWFEELKEKMGNQ